MSAQPVLRAAAKGGPRQLFLGATSEQLPNLRNVRETRINLCWDTEMTFLFWGNRIPAVLKNICISPEYTPETTKALSTLFPQAALPGFGNATICFQGLGYKSLIFIKKTFQSCLEPNQFLIQKDFGLQA